MSFFEERGEPEYPEKNLGTKERTNKKLNPHMALMPGFERGPQWCERVLSPLRHHLLPKELKPSLNINKKFYKNIFRSID